jgi:hypothetical protein
LIEDFNRQPHQKKIYRFTKDDNLSQTDKEIMAFFDDEDLNSVIKPAKGFLGFGGGYLLIDFDGKGGFHYIRGKGDKKARFLL